MVPLRTQRASSSVPPFSSTSPRPRWMHDVFLNFHGEDTRKSIITFKDDEKHERGKYISQELLKVIRESMYAIPIISKNYASSRWCLTELAQIVECMRETSLTIFPIFYYVDPSEVPLYFTINYMKLHHALSLWICHHALSLVHIIHGMEITKRILQGLSRNFSSLSKIHVGTESCVEEMMNILGIELDDVRFVGIHGMGGVGKTTLVEVIYDKISYQFEASSFIACISEETRNRGLIFMEREINIWDDHEGMNMIRNRICNKKFLLVLDDVDRENHLTALVGSHDWFGLGSKVILTSRDNHFLKRHGANDIYKVSELNNDEALQLFSLAAFKKSHPEENYVDLSKGFVKYDQGLPLALNVLGSSLFGRGTNAWKGLDSILTDILESFGCYPYFNIDILMEKCLIKISSKRLRMHDLLQKMGHKIIYDESPEEPGQCGRLWHCKDVLHGTEVIEGIVLNLPYQKDQERFSVKTFSQIKKLRILKICNTSIVNCFSNLYDKLRMLEWSKYPSKSLSNTFQADNLIELRFPCNHIKQLWKGFKSLGSLKCFDLSSSQNMLETPDLTGVPNLETLDLESYTSLSKVHKSIGVLKWLRRVNLHACKHLKSFPNEISLESLEYFYISDCSRFEKFADIV
ncbi:hypothetical protein I3760_07G052000 [Carya illinoinensis]|nr:hypothetical protein I3760_07G052000 [Carya illinoinensis]